MLRPVLYFMPCLVGGGTKHFSFIENAQTTKEKRKTRGFSLLDIIEDLFSRTVLESCHSFVDFSSSQETLFLLQAF